MSENAGGMANQRQVYMNGEIVAEADARVHVNDRGFIYGDAVFDTARTFGGETFRLREHIDRLYRSLRYVDIDPGLSKAALTEISSDIVARNRHLLGPDDDYWIFQRITRGANDLEGPGAHEGPTVIVLTVPLPLAKRAALFRDGIEIAVPPTRRTPPESLSPNAKTHNYLNLIVAANEVKDSNPGAWPILLDTRGFLTEGSGSNLFLVRDGEVLTPKREYVLAGISRDVALEQCEALSIPYREADLTLFDAATADEAFITSTSLCLCSVRAIQGRALADPAVPGPVTRRLQEAFAKVVGHDFVGQYLAHLKG